MKWDRKQTLEETEGRVVSDVEVRQGGGQLNYSPHEIRHSKIERQGVGEAALHEEEDQDLEEAQGEPNVIEGSIEEIISRLFKIREGRQVTPGHAGVRLRCRTAVVAADRGGHRGHHEQGGEGNRCG